MATVSFPLRRQRPGVLVCGLLTAAFALVGCNVEKKQATEAEKQRVTIDGSSTVYPLSNKMKEEFEKVDKQAEIIVSFSGSGNGFKKLIRNELDIADASRAIKPSEVEALKKEGITAIELPVALDGITVVVNKENTFVDKLTVEQLKELFKEGSEITTWKQLNPAWPDEEIKLITPDDNSGTMHYFCEEILGTQKVNGETKHKPIRTGVTKCVDDVQTVNYVTSDKNALGFFGFAYYLRDKDKLKAVPIVPEGKTEGVLPSTETIANGEYTPLSRKLFIYVNSKSLTRPVVVKFVTFYLDSLEKYVPEVGYVPLPAEKVKEARKQFEQAAEQAKTGE